MQHLQVFKYIEKVMTYRYAVISYDLSIKELEDKKNEKETP